MCERNGGTLCSASPTHIKMKLGAPKALDPCAIIHKNLESRENPISWVLNAKICVKNSGTIRNASLTYYGGLHIIFSIFLSAQIKDIRTTSLYTRKMIKIEKFRKVDS